MIRDRRGFTLTELLVVAVLGALLVVAALQVLITNQQTYTAQTAQIQGQQTTRAAVDILFNELREISAQGGDIIKMGDDVIVVRTMRKFGAVCGITKDNPPTLRVIQVGDWFENADSAFVFADNDPALATDDVWIPALVTSVDTAVACGATRAQDLKFAGQSAPFTADSVRTGAPVRSFTQFTYGVITYDGKSYLGRTAGGGSSVPLVGPLSSSSGIEFVYLDALGSTTAVTTDVRQIQVTVRTTSGVTNSLGNAVSDSITALIYTRN